MLNNGTLMMKVMHEVSIITSILESVLEELKKYEIERVEEIVLLVGDLTFLGDEQLTFAYEVLTKGTILEGSKLTIEKEPIMVECSECMYEGEVDYLKDESYRNLVPIISCPKCGKKVEVTKGRSCMVRSAKVVER